MEFIWLVGSRDKTQHFSAWSQPNLQKLKDLAHAFTKGSSKKLYIIEVANMPAKKEKTQPVVNLPNAVDVSTFTLIIQVRKILKLSTFKD